MRNDVFSTNPLRLNAIREDILVAGGSDYALAVGSASRSGALSTYPQNPQRERKKEAKKERESTTATVFVSKTGNYNCRQREIIIDARQKTKQTRRNRQRHASLIGAEKNPAKVVF